MLDRSGDDHPLAGDLDHILTHTAEVWEAVRNQCVFVTGGTGFFGRWLLESFADANQSLGLNARMVVLSRDPATFLRRAPHFARGSAISLVKGDVRTFTAAQVQSQLGDTAPKEYQFFIHAATEASATLNADDPLRMIETIVEGTRHALDFSVEMGTTRFLYTSSGAIYGQQPPEMTHVSEEYRGAPDCAVAASAYGEAKRVAELLCVCYAKQTKLEPLIARCFAFVGPFLPLDAHFAIGNFIRDALRGGPIKVGGDGTPYRSYLYAADLMIWLWRILVSGEPARPYNVGSEEGMSIAAIADAVAAICPRPMPVTIRDAPGGGAALRYVPSTARAGKELGLVVHFSLSEALRRTLTYLQSPQVSDL